MDCISITSALTTKLISALLSKYLKRKLGAEVSINIKKLDAVVNDDGVKLKLDLDAETSKEDYEKIFQEVIK